MKSKKLLVKLLTISFSTALLFNSCISTKQEYYINKDGNGKVKVAVEMPLNMNFQMGQEKASEKINYEDSVKMIKKVREIINESKGFEAWEDINYHIDDQGMLNFSATAYFSDIKSIDMGEVPILPVNHFSRDKIIWMADKLANNMNTKKGMQKTNIKESNLDETVDKIQQQFRQSKMMMGMILTAFQLEATYHLPYKIKSLKNLEKKDNYTVQQNSNLLNSNINNRSFYSAHKFMKTVYKL